MGLNWMKFLKVHKKESEKPEENINIDKDKLPVHIAIIMDGNGRWATRRGLPRVMGHRAGVESLREIVKTCVSLGINYLTVFAFSTENWKRPVTEVNILMDLLVEYLHKEINELNSNNVRIKAIGGIDELPQKAQSALARAEKLTISNSGLVLTLALNYGGRNEIAEAVKRIGIDILNHKLNPYEINQDTISDYLYTSGMPDPDLLIRPSGELRISNFLLWQVAYSEFWYSPVMWPDFRKAHLLEAILDYQQRHRRFGGLNSDK